MEAVVYYLVTGLLAGVPAGMLGIGGGVIAVPLLAATFVVDGVPREAVMHLAVGTSLAAIVFTSLSSAWAHHRAGAVDWVQVRACAPALVAGAVGGAFVAQIAAGEHLLTALGVVEVLVAVQMAVNFNPQAARFPFWRAIKHGLAVLVAGVSVVAGSGGGLFIVPLLMMDGFEARRAIATSSACGIPIALVGALVFVVFADVSEPIIPFTFGYIHGIALLCVAVMSVLGAQVGAYLAHRIPTRLMRRVFAAVLMVLGMKILTRGI